MLTDKHVPLWKTVMFTKPRVISPSDFKVSESPGVSWLGYVTCVHEQVWHCPKPHCHCNPNLRVHQHLQISNPRKSSVLIHSTWQHWKRLKSLPDCLFLPSTTLKQWNLGANLLKITVVVSKYCSIVYVKNNCILNKKHVENFMFTEKTTPE